MANLTTQLAPNHPRGLKLANPVMAAAGTFGYGVEYSQFIDIQRLGAIICKGTTLEPCEGNPQPRLMETPSGLLNSIGLQNIGLKALLSTMTPVWSGWQVPVIVNIAGQDIEEYAKLASKLDESVGIAALEVNISCPNVDAGGVAFGTQPKIAAEVTKRVKTVTSLPLIMKLTPNVTDITQIARAVAQAGADAVSLINTLNAMAIDLTKRRPFLGNITGGLSGPAIKPVALFMVYQVARAVSIPVIGCGGISCASDALEFIMAGASAVQVGTVSFANPCAALEILKGIESFMEQEGVEEISELIGLAQRPLGEQD